MMRFLGRRASVAVEFALLAPVMLMLGGVMYVVGSLLHANSTANKLAMEYAISYANCSDTSSGACGTELALYETTATIKNIFPQLFMADLTLSMAQASVSGTAPNLTATLEYPTGGSLTAAQTAALVAVVPSGQTGVVVTATYTFYPLVLQPLVQPFIGSSVTMSYTVAQLK